MKIKYLAHASFLVTADTGLKIVTDPYVASFISGEGPCYGDIEEAADIVTVSHGHSDHNNVSTVRGKPEVVKKTGITRIKGVEFRGIPTYHDDGGGKMRGSNTVFCFEVDGIKLCHLGDLGHKLSDRQVAEIGIADILLIPVGGYYTIDAKVATQVCDKLTPRVVIPMHYKTKKCGLPIAVVDEFLQGKKNVSRLDSSEVEFKPAELPATVEIMVLQTAL